MPPATKRTLADATYQRLRAELFAGTLAPGQPLRMLSLAERYEVSVAVLREALTRLAEQHLVEASPQRGFRVMEPSVDHLRDVTTVRVQLESIALRQSIERGDIAWEAAVAAATHTLLHTPIRTGEALIDEDWLAAHWRFHAALLAGSGSPMLEKITDNLRDQSELYRVWSWSFVNESRARDLSAEHQAIASATLERDADTAVVLLAEHMWRTSTALIDHLTPGTDHEPAPPRPAATGR